MNTQEKADTVMYAESDRRISLPDKEAALQRALEIGISPEALIALGQDTFVPPDQSDHKFVKYALVTAGVLIASDVAISAITGNPAGEIARSAANLLLTPGNAPVAEASWKAVVGAVEQWGMTTLQNIVILGYYMGVLRSQLTKSDQIKSIKELQASLQKAKELGEAPILMPDGWHAINLGSGDAQGRAIGKKLGWGEKALPLLESDKNSSGYDLWLQISDPSKGMDKEVFFASLNKVGFDRASSITFCPVEEQQAFLPDPENPSHFDLTFDQIVDRINLIDEYCDVKGLPRKKIIIIGDKNIQRGIGPASLNAKGEIEYGNSVPVTLAEMVDMMNKEEDSAQKKMRPHGSEIIIADPTEITLELLKSDEYNPDHLPLRYYEDPKAPEKYAKRFIERAQQMGHTVITEKDFSGKCLHIGYGINDVSTTQTAKMLPSDQTLAIIIDEARASGGKFKKLILSNVVRDWVISKLDS